MVNGGPAALRSLLASGPVLAAGCYDALSARLAEVAGHKALEISGLAVEASYLASPDLGMMTRTDMLTVARNIVDAVALPVICDVDTGFGDELQVARTVRLFEASGVAGLHIEDQSEPKMCPLYDTPTVVSREEGVARIVAAVEARRNSDFVIIGRTDAYGDSFEEAVVRANLYIEAGADMAMSPMMVVDGASIHSLSPSEQYKWLCRFAQEVNGPVIGLLTPFGYAFDDMISGGYHSMMMATLGVQAAANALLRLYESAVLDGTGARYFETNPRDERSFGLGLANVLGLQDALSLRSRGVAQTLGASEAQASEP